MGGMLNTYKMEDPSNFDNTNGGEIQKTRMISPKTINSRVQYNSMNPDFVSTEKTPHFTTNASPDKNCWKSTPAGILIFLDKTPQLIRHKTMFENTRSPKRQIKFFRGHNE